MVCFLFSGRLFSSLSYMYGIRGRKKLVIDRYTFFRFGSSKNSQTWYCSQRKPKNCKACVRLFLDGTMIIVNKNHSHPARELRAPIYVAKSIQDLYYDLL